VCAAVFVFLYPFGKECRLCHSSFSLGSLPRGLDFFPLKFFSLCLSRSPLARKRFHGHIAVAKVTLPTDPPTPLLFPSHFLLSSLSHFVLSEQFFFSLVFPPPPPIPLPLLLFTRLPFKMAASRQTKRIEGGFTFGATTTWWHNFFKH